MKEGIKIGKKELAVDGWHPDYYGASHAKRHFKPLESSPRKVANTIVTGKRSKDKEKLIVSGRNSQKATSVNEGKKKLKLITAYKDTRDKKKK